MTSGSLLVQWTPVTIGFAVLAVLGMALAVVKLRSAPPAPERSSGPAGTDDAATTSVFVGKGETLAEAVSAGDVDRNAFLSRFIVTAQGEQKGETVGFLEDRVVVKQGSDFYLLQTGQVLVKDGQLLATPDIDWDEAAERGEKWRTAVRDEMRYDDEGMPILDQ